MTDSRHYVSLAVHGALRFSPHAQTKAEIARMHATDERLAVDSYRGALCVTRNALRLFGGRAETVGAGGSHSGGDHVEL
jgi:acetylornithine deacetylase/succinyl-diaminopimelate desuccinylase-like protein